MFARLVSLGAAVLVVLSVSIPAGAAAPRAILSLSDPFLGGNVDHIAMPDSGDGIDLSGFSIEAGEPVPSCASGPFARSGWFKIFHPGGTLDINTAFATGSGFDTVVQIFPDNTGVLTELHELGCDNDSGGGNDARLVMPGLASSTYLVRIVCRLICTATSDLALSVSYSPGEPAPANDSAAGAQTLEIGKVVVTQNAEHATVEAGESALSCYMRNSVWYSVTIPYDGVYSFNTFGSYAYRGSQPPSDTRLAVYGSDGTADFASFSLLGCSLGFGSGANYSSLPAVGLLAGQVIYVRVGTGADVNLLNGSYYRLKSAVVSLENVLVNAGFEASELAPWTLTVANAQNGVTSANSFLGTHSMLMTGSPDATNTLKQKWSPANFSLSLPKKATAHASMVYSTDGTVADSAKAVLTATYTDGTPATTVSRKLQKQTGGGFWEDLYLFLPLASRKVATLTLSFKNKSSAGTLYVDNTVLKILGDPTRDAQMPAGLIAAPHAPGR